MSDDTERDTPDELPAGQVEPGPLEQIAQQVGKSAAEVAAFDRFFAGLREHAVARFNFNVVCAETAGSFRNFADAMENLDHRLTVKASAEIAQHPDLAYLNTQMDGYYGGA